MPATSARSSPAPAGTADPLPVLGGAMSLLATRAVVSLATGVFVGDAAGMVAAVSVAAVGANPSSAAIVGVADRAMTTAALVEIGAMTFAAESG
jgi:hypothetical protein